jgi:hypothetical protein
MDDETLKQFSKAEEVVLVLLAFVIVLVAFIGTMVIIITALALLNGIEITAMEQAHLGLIRESYVTAFAFILLLGLIILQKELWIARKRLEVASRTHDIGRLLDAVKGGDEVR